MEKYIVRLTKEEYAEKNSEDFRRIRELSHVNAAQHRLSVQDTVAEKRHKDVERQRRCRDRRKLQEVKAGLQREDGSRIIKVC